MKQTIVAILAAALSGCSGATAWIAAHKTEIVYATLVGGAVQATTGAVSSTIRAARDVREVVVPSGSQ